MDMDLTWAELLRNLMSERNSMGTAWQLIKVHNHIAFLAIYLFAWESMQISGFH